MKRLVLIVSLLALNRLLTANAQTPTEVPTGKKFHIQSAMNYGKNNGGYWDIPGKPSTIKKGSNIQVWNLDGGHDRTFSMHFKDSEGYYEIKIGNTTNSRVDIQGRGTKNGTSVKTWTRNHQNNQKFLFHHLGNGRFKIFDKNSGKILCLKGRNNNNGTNVHIWHDHHGSSVEWYLIDVNTKTAYNPSQSEQNITEVKIGEQVWMGENLNVSQFRNGDPIPVAQTYSEYLKATNEKKPISCYYNLDSANGVKYGKLYNWYAVNDPRGLAPNGWRLPSDADWKQLVDFLGDKSSVKLKSKSGWKQNGNGTDIYGFSALPAGSLGYTGYGSGIGLTANWWTSTENSDEKAWFWNANYNSKNHPNAGRFESPKSSGYSVRCIKD